jgi:hypothetical protein
MARVLAEDPVLNTEDPPAQGLLGSPPCQPQRTRRLTDSSAEAMHAATQANARILGIDDVTGAIEQDRAAGLVITAANPLEDIRTPVLTYANAVSTYLGLITLGNDAWLRFRSTSARRHPWRRLLGTFPRGRPVGFT